MKSYNSKKPFMIILSLVALFHLIMINISFFNIEEKGIVKGAVIHNVYLKHYGLSQKGKGSGSSSEKEEGVIHKKTSRKVLHPNPVRAKKKELGKSQKKTDISGFTESFTKELSEDSDVPETAYLYEGTRGISAGDVTGSSIAGISIEHIKRTYLDSLKLEIERHKEYPFRASWRNQTGTVGVFIVILKDGSITDIRLKSPSRHQILNEAAIKLLSEIKKFRPIPDELRLERWEIVINIEYYLTLN